MDDALGHLSIEEQEELRATFYSQAFELLEALNDGILRLEAGEKGEDLLKEIQRSVHTLKGDSASFGLRPLTLLTHKMEDLLSFIRERAVPLDREVIDLLFYGADACQKLLREELDPHEIGEFLIRLEGFVGEAACLSGRQVGKGRSEDPITEYQRLQIASALKEGFSLYEIEVKFDPTLTMRSAGAFLLADALSQMGEVIRSEPPLDGNLEGCHSLRLLVSSALDPASLEQGCLIPGVVARAKAFSYLPEEKRQVQEVPARSAQRPEKATFRVEAQRIDKVMNLVGELVIAYSAFHQAFERLLDRFPKDEALGRMEEANGLMERTLSDLQKSVFEIRMVPIEFVFRRLPRLVRDLAAESGKLITLTIEGRETELDRGIVDLLGEPLVHLLRNAVDHGIEPPEERRRLGKPPEGTITLRARHEGNSIIIEVEDDGRGIDPEKVKRKAAERGLIGVEELKLLDDAEAFNLIFTPGFSTAEAVTSTSGRGIGMDAVKAAVERLKGSIRVDSKVGRGTRLTLRLPLTLAIIKAMLFEVEGQLFAIPLSSIVEVARAFPSEIPTVDGKEVLRLRGRVISLIRLSHVLNIPAPLQPPATSHQPPAIKTGKAFVLVIGLSERRIGLLVERLVGEQELVIKTLDDGWIPTGLLAGASILGDGKVALILDPAALVEKAVRLEKMKRQELGVSVWGLKDGEDQGAGGG